MINIELKRYLEQEILPQYDNYDKGHNRDHILEVANGSLELANNREVNLDMVYTAAIFHDIGLCEGRDIHHLASAKMLRSDNFISNYFSATNLEIIAQAIEDHRASSKESPRSIYGEILSSADRIINLDTIILRSFYHSEKHCPHYSTIEHINRIYNHIQDKYGEGGYLKIPILTKRNKEALQHLRAMIVNQDEFKDYCSNLLNL